MDISTVEGIIQDINIKLHQMPIKIGTHVNEDKVVYYYVELLNKGIQRLIKPEFNEKEVIEMITNDIASLIRKTIIPEKLEGATRIVGEFDTI